jgi:hypothetical protein
VGEVDQVRYRPVSQGPCVDKAAGIEFQKAKDLKLIVLIPRTHSPWSKDH